MHFDLACCLIERYLPEFTELFEKAALFKFNLDAHKVLKKNNEYPQELLDNFVLPFPITAIEDNAGLVILSDTVNESIGVNSPRMFMDVVPTCSQVELFGDMPNTGLSVDAERKNLEQLAGIFPKSATISIGGINEIFTKDKGKFAYSVEMLRVYFVDKKQGIVLDQGRGTSEMAQAAVRNAATAFEELFMLNNDKNFIVEASPLVVPKKSKKLYRAHQRPNYTFLTLSETQRILNHKPMVQSPGRKSPEPHARRRHLRRLTKEAGFKEDKIVVVKASWIGPEEYADKNRVYKVRLDL